MTTHSPDDQVLLGFLAAQRGAVLDIVAGLPEEAWQRPVVPSGWTVAGLVEHLGGAERHWFWGIVADNDVDLPWDEGLPPFDPNGPFACDRPSAQILEYYREVCQGSDAVLAVTPLSARPPGQHRGEQPPDVRWVVLHLIEETARHAGHLDLARELLDGRTGLGVR